jgi:hypothetical protein
VRSEVRLLFLANPLRHLRIEKVSIRKPWLAHSDLEMIVKSGVLAGQTLVTARGASACLETSTVAAGWIALVFQTAASPPCWSRASMKIESLIS